MYDGDMALAHSKLTSQGQISVPVAVRRKLGIGPGSILEWEEEEGKIVVRRLGRYTFEDIYKAVFADKPKKKVSVEDMNEAIGTYMRKRYARR
jgi:AbrB family looped-hinge helix DNA binding protein